MLKIKIDLWIKDVELKSNGGDNGERNCVGESLFDFSIDNLNDYLLNL